MDREQSFDADEIDLLTAKEEAVARQVSGRFPVTLLHRSFSNSGYIDPSAALAIIEMIELPIRHRTGSGVSLH
ncbi:MAG TPA: hypothetical protein VK854_15640 [Woeseiaceae bacterium]|nr:hypothetical protein [Woeseiaceae bacterium]